MNKAESRRQNKRLRRKINLKWNRKSSRIGGMRRGLDSSRDSINIFDSIQMADGCLGASVDQAGFIFYF